MCKKYSGLLLVNKPQGITSHDVVYKVRKKLGIKSVGHTGTLDPFASGLMALVIGQATRLSKYFISGNKAYNITIRLGLETSTWDREGDIVFQSGVIPSEKIIQNTLQGLLNAEEFQIPPYSAKKVNGKKLYELARKGEEVPVIYKPMKFWNLQIHNIENDIIQLQFECIKGSFVRSFVQELGKNLGCGAHVAELERTYSEPYCLNQAIELENLSADSLEDCLIPMEDLFHKWPVVQLTNAYDSKLMANGQIPKSIIPECLNHIKSSDQHLKVVSCGKLSSILYVNQNKQIKIDNVFN